MTIAIINYELGNLRSVENAVRFLGYDAVIAGHPGELEVATHIILPGVGAFGEGIGFLNERGWSDQIRAQAKSGKPFLGICLGMQLLATTGSEHGDHAGLNLIPGTVRKLEAREPETRVPHIGWNVVRPVNEKKMYAGHETEQTFYFVHSYAFEPGDSGVISGLCNHGADFAASVEQGNIWGTQYHPEKSQKAGLAVLKNFMAL